MKYKVVIIGLFFAFSFFSCKKKTAEVAPKEMPELNTGIEVEPKYGMEKTGEHTYQYTSPYGVSINIHFVPADHPALTVTHTDFNFGIGTTLQFWGGPDTGGSYPYLFHEKLNGKHIKDRKGRGRTIIAPSGLKITMAGEGSEEFDITGVTIYDHGVVQHINTLVGVLEYSDLHPDFATELDGIQPDGETLTYEKSNDRVIFYNTYYEETIGNKIEKRMDLGSINLDQINEVNKLYQADTSYP